MFISLKYFNIICHNEEEGIIEAGAGASLPALARKALLWGIEGFEGLEGIPGTVGGGVFMNAGAYSYEIKDCLLAARGILRNGEPFELTNDELHFSCRNSILRDRPGEYIITSIVFSARKGAARAIYNRMELYHAKRHRYQDFLYPTLGSLFTEPDIYFAIGHKDKAYRFKYDFLKRLWYSKKIRRETPINRCRMNDFVCRYFKWSFDVQPFSNKTMNCITNRGQHTDKFLEYIDMLKQHLPESATLENEIVRECLYEI